MELGASALSFLISTWEGHLTPSEAASVADKASKSRDAAMVRTGASLALSVLPHAASLNQNEIQRAIQQCKEQRDEMLEQACEAVENAAATGGGVYPAPEVLFEVARHWHDLFEKNNDRHQRRGGEQPEQHLHPPPQQGLLQGDQHAQQQALPAADMANVVGQQQNVFLSLGGALAAAVPASSAGGNFHGAPLQAPSLQVRVHPSFCDINPPPIA
jgi:hypothetical protein